MYFIKRLLKQLEGDGLVCICCKRRTEKIEISGDGVCICKTCYRKLLENKVGDYYDVDGNVGRLFAPFGYTGKIRDMILELKFHGSFAYAKPLARLLYDALPPYYDYSAFDLIVPVPLHAKRLEERGYNQAELIANELSMLLAIPMAADVLFRIRNTERQMSLARKNRLRNVRNAFWADKSVFGKSILLIDDIYTVGATVSECAAALLKQGAARINAVVLCTNFRRESDYIRLVAIPTVYPIKNSLKGVEKSVNLC